ncbi:MAG TPA: CD225/dispanin family protein [Acidimicrobiales bacterium]|nr:CD225/dispanin family protein [Acidimicrobiales bacterium]
MSRKIFVSYARADRRLVELLVGDLRGSGHEPFFDEALAGGESWWDELLTQIEGCDVFVPALTTAYLSSQPCKLEADHAGALGKPFLPVSLESVSNRLLVPRIAQAQWVAYNPQDRNAILDLMRGLNAVPACPPLPDPMPPRPAVPISYLTDLKSSIDTTGELSRNQQVLVLADLKARLGGDERADVVLLLQRFRMRPDLYFQVATEIDSLLAGFPPAQEWPQPPPPRQPQGPERPTGTPGGPANWPPPAPPPPPPSWPGTAVPATSGHSGGWGTPAAGQAGHNYASAPPSQAKPANHLVWTILATVFFCLPLGLVGIYFSTQVDKKYFIGDLAGAQEASRRARTWAIVSAIVGVIAIVILIAVALSHSTTTTPSSGF